MRGSKLTLPINLFAEEVKSFQQLIRAHSTPQAVAVRARITPSLPQISNGV